jgi:uncharacterized Tic20 family protein
MDDQDRIVDLNGENVNNDDSAVDQSVEGEGVPIPDRIRDAVQDVGRRVKEEMDRGRDVVKEYEERYYGSNRRSRLESPADEDLAPPEGVYVPVKTNKRKHFGEPDANERKWAALAHGSTLLTALVALASAGAGVLLTMFIPLCIYFAFRKRSEYVAFHALQAFTIQLVGTIGWLALVVTGLVVWIALLILSALLILVLVGLVLLPLVALMFPVFLLVSLALPLGMVIYSVIATIETWNGHNYRYPYIADWVENQLQGSVFSIF